MPFIIPFIPVLAALTGAAAIAVTVALTVVEMAAMMLLAKLIAPKQGTQLSDGTTQEYSGTVEPRRIVYGYNCVSGLNAVPPWCHGTNAQMLDQVLVLAGHAVNYIGDCYAGQVLIPDGAIGPITQSANDGKVTSGTYTNKLWLRRHTGQSGELIDYILNAAWPAAWDTNHMGIGLAKLFIQYQYDTTVFSGGKPAIRCMVQGKLLYDPRLDITPGANPFNPTYMRYSANPALCIIDYILDPVLGIGETSARIDWVWAVAAANCCDELVAIPLLASMTPAWSGTVRYVYGNMATVAGTVYMCIGENYNISPPNVTYWQALAGGSYSQPRYTCNQVIDCTINYEQNLAALAASMQGSVLYSGGKWILYPGKWQTPTFAIGDDDIAGAFSYETAFPFANRYNAVRGQFYDPSAGYSPSEYPPIRVSADEIADGEGPVWQELQQASCIDQFEAQRNAIILQRKSRRKKRWSFPATYSMFSIRPGDFGTLSITELGIALQYVRCTGWTLDGKAMNVALTLEEVNPTDWYDPAPAVYQTTTNMATPAPATFVSDPVSALTASGGAGGITFKWTLPPIWHSNLSVELMEAALNDIATATMIWSGVNTGAFIQKGDTTVRYYWVRVRNIAGNTVSVNNPLLANAGLAASATSIVGPPGPTGGTGDGGLVGSLTLQAIVLPATAAGHVSSYAGASGKFRVFLGTVDITSQCSFTLAPGGNPNGLTYTLDGGVSLTVVSSAQSQSTHGTGGGVSIGSSAQAQTTSAALGSVGATWDSVTPTWDSIAMTWDSTGSGGGTPVAVTGTGSSAE